MPTNSSDERNPSGERPEEKPSGMEDSRAAEAELAKRLADFADQRGAWRREDSDSDDGPRADEPSDLLSEVDVIREIESLALQTGPPSQLGPYKLIRLIGRGGMGDVYLAWQQALGRTVALKVLKQNLLEDKNARKRFEREARVAAGLHHPNIVPVYDLGVDAGWPFYAMELVEGETLRQIQKRVQESDDGTPVALAPGEVQERTRTTMWLKASSSHAWRGNTPGSGIPVFPAGVSGEAVGLQGETSADTDLARKEVKGRKPSEALAVPGADPGTEAGSGSSSGFTHGNGKSTFYKWLSLAMAGAADGLNYAHNHEVLHRDIKPSNLMLDENGSLRILDFGLAWVEDDMELTGSGRFVGTIPFMSPEQAQGGHEDLSRGSDIYGLGATIYSVLSGRPVFQGSSYKETLHQISHDDPTPLRKVNGHIPRDVETIVMKCLRKSPRDRYLTAEALAQDLRRYAEGEPIEARPVPPWLRLLNGMWRRRARILQGAAVLVLLVAAAFLVTGHLARVERDRERASQAEISLAALVRMTPSSASADLAPGHTNYSPVVPDTLQVLSKYQPRNSSTFLPVWLPVGPFLPEVESSRVQSAVSLLESSLLQRDSPQGRCALAVGYVALGRYEEARKAVERALQLDPDLKEALATQRLVESYGVQVHPPRRPEPLTQETEEWIKTWVQAQAASLAGDWEEAGVAFLSLLAKTPDSEKRSPGHLRNLLSTAVALSQTRRTDEALAYLSEARNIWQELEEMPVDVGLLKGWLLLKAHPGVGREVEVFTRIHDELHGDVRRRDKVALRIAGMYRQVRDYKAALSWLKRIEHPTTASLRLEAELLLHMGDVEAALLNAREALALEEASSEVENQILLGNILPFAARQKRQEAEAEEEKDKKKELNKEADALMAEALKAYEAAIALAPEDPRGYVARGLLRESEDDLQRAADDFGEAVRLAHHCASAHFHLGRLMETKGKLQDAIHHYEQARRWNPSDPLAATHLGSLLAGHDRTTEAIELLSRARDTDPGLPQARYNLGLVYLQVNRYDEAVEEFREAIRLGLGSGVVQHNLGATLQSLCRYFDAMQQYKPLVDELLQEYRSNSKTAEELRQNKGFIAALLNRANGMYKEYRADVAIPLYREVLELWPDSPDVHSYLGYTLAESPSEEHNVEAIQALEKAVRLRPRDPLLRARLAYRIRENRLLPDGQRLADLIRLLEEDLLTRERTASVKQLLEACRRRHFPTLASLASVDWLLTKKEIVLRDDSDWQYFRGTAEPSKTLEWTQADFEPEPDKPWQTGEGPFGYDTKGQATLRTHLDDMQGEHTTLYLRCEFSVARTDQYEELTLTVKYDDAFVVYLNGTEIARRNISSKEEPIPFEETADAAFTGTADIEVPVEFLEPGRNALAFQIFNHTKISSDLFLSAELTATWAPDPQREERMIQELEQQDTGPGSAARLRYLKGRIRQLRGNTEEAITEFLKAHEASPGRAEPLVRIAECRRDLGDTQGALEAVQTGILEGRQPEEPLWGLWLQFALPEPGKSLEEALAGFPEEGVPSEGYGADLWWVLEQLRDHGVVRINCGGEAYRGPDGRYWGTDRFHAGGSVYSGFRSAPSEIHGTEDDPLYQTERNLDSYTRMAPDHLYSIPLPRGVYTVTLHFAEIWYEGESQRVFDVSLEGERKLTSHDPLAEEGKRATANIKGLSGIEVADGRLEIQLTSVHGQPQICAIEIEREQGAAR